MSASLFITSRALSAVGVTHGFSVRAAGDLRAAGELARLAEAAGLRTVATAKQVHGDRVLGALRDGRQEELFAASEASVAGAEGADAMVALEPEVAVGVFTADCVPVLLYAEDMGTAAVVHSGWRGARLSIAARGVRALQQATGADPKLMIAAVGPCIGACCYEVSPELAATFRDLFGADVADDRRHLDLRRVVERTLRQAGVERIEQVEGCTSCDPGSFFSYRRDRYNTGRQLSFVRSGFPTHLSSRTP